MKLEKIINIIAIIIILIAAIGVIIMFGHAFNIKAAYGWGNITYISVISAVVLFAFGCIIILKILSQQKLTALILSIPVFGVLLLVTIGMCIAIIVNEYQKYTLSIQQEAQFIAREFSQYQQDFYKSVERMRFRWEREDYITETKWQEDAQRNLNDYPFIFAISYVDPNSIIKWVTPVAYEKEVSGKPFNYEPIRKKATEEAIATRSPQITPTVDLRIGGLGYLYISPIFIKNKYNGLLAIVISYKKFFSEIFKDQLKKYYVTITDNNKIIFSNTNNATVPDEFFIGSATIPINKNWTIAIYPRAKDFIQYSYNLPIFVFIIGLFISLITTFATYLLFKYKESLKALHATNERLQLAVTGSTDALWDWNIKTGEVYYSPRFYEMLGYDADEIKNDIESLNLLIHPDDIVRSELMLQEHLGQHNKYDIEYRLRHKEGHYIWCHARGITSWDKAKKPVRLTGFLSEVTERKFIQDELHKHKDRLQAIMDASNFAIVTCDLAGVIRLFNPAAQHMFGYKANEVISKCTPAMFHIEGELSERAKNFSKQFKRHVNSGLDTLTAPLERDEIYEDEWVLVRKDGTTFSAQVSVTKLRNKSNATVGYLIISQDITERKAVESLKNDFISTVNHELRTPITSIRGSLGILSSGTLGKFNTQIADMISIALRNCERLTKLVNAILDIQKIETGHMDFDIKTIDLNSLLDEVIMVNQSYADQYNINLSLSQMPKLFFVEADADKLIQVFTNLLSNAIKYSPSGDEVNISVKPDGKYIIVAVHDNGEGIPSNFQKQIFKKFVQADSSNTRKHEGTGLGLSISKAFLEKMGASISFESDRENGTTFYVKLAVVKETVLQQ